MGGEPIALDDLPLDNIKTEDYVDPSDITTPCQVYMLWFKFIFGLKFFKPVWFLFPFVLDYDNKYETMEIKNQTGLKNFKQKINLNHNVYIRQLLEDITLWREDVNSMFKCQKRSGKISPLQDVSLDLF